MEAMEGRSFARSWTRRPTGCHVDTDDECGAIKPNISRGLTRQRVSRDYTDAQSSSSGTGWGVAAQQRWCLWWDFWQTIQHRPPVCNGLHVLQYHRASSLRCARAAEPTVLFSMLQHMRPGMFLGLQVGLAPAAQHCCAYFAPRIFPRALLETPKRVARISCGFPFGVARAICYAIEHGHLRT